MTLRVFVLLMVLTAMSCKKPTEPPPPPPPERVKLTLIDVGVREVYLHVAVASPVGNEALTLLRDGTVVMTFPAVADTNIVDTALTQSTTYHYDAPLSADGQTTGTSNTISAQTPVPTSHDFTWQTFFLGDGNGSALYDVAILNDSLAFAVGEIYLGGDPTCYNVAVWSGNSWSLERLTYQGSPPVIRSVFASSSNDVWLDPWFHWDGQFFHEMPINPIFLGIGINKMWGTVDGQIYVVGSDGFIGYRNTSGAWQRLASGTTTHILDAWGVTNPVTSKEEVYCPVTSFFEPGDRRILRIRNATEIDSIPWGPGRDVNSAWTNRGLPIYVCGDGIFENGTGRWREIELGVHIGSNAIRGTALNDIFVVGGFGLVAHYNGVEWHVFTEVYNALYSSLHIVGNVVAIVGQRNARGVVTIGRRN